MGEADGTERFAFKNCPMTLSTDAGSPYALTTVENGVRFDLDGDGQLERVAWVEAATDIAFLALDQDGDGRVTSGRELIGGHTFPGASNGPNALMQLAAPQKVAVLDASTPAFERILLWRDANHNGSSEPVELRRAHDELTAIGLGFGFHRSSDRHGNYSRFRGFVHVRTEPGSNAVTSVETSGRDGVHMHHRLVSE